MIKVHIFIMTIQIIWTQMVPEWRTKCKLLFPIRTVQTHIHTYTHIYISESKEWKNVSVNTH